EQCAAASLRQDQDGSTGRSEQTMIAPGFTIRASVPPLVRAPPTLAGIPGLPEGNPPAPCTLRHYFAAVRIPAPRPEATGFAPVARSLAGASPPGLRLGRDAWSARACCNFSRFQPRPCPLAVAHFLPLAPTALHARAPLRAASQSRKRHS